MKKIFLIPFILLLLLSGCVGTTEKKPKESEETKKAAVAVPDFNADSAYVFVQKQVAFGPRVPNTKAHDLCGAYLVSTMKKYCPTVYEQKGTVKAYNGAILNFRNIITAINPMAANRILLIAHWDARPYADQDPDPKNHIKPIDAANDGASGVGVLMELARAIARDTAHHPPVGVDLFFCDAEDYGPPQDVRTGEDTEPWWGLGSQYWAKNPHKADYFAKYGILLDMVGAKGATFLQEGISMSYAPDVVKNVWNLAQQAGYGNYFISEPGLMITDDHVYINKYRNIPTIDIIHLDKTGNTGFYPYWHTMKDNMDGIDKNTLKAVGQTLLTVIYNEQ
jgi:glutaminyl-peptide cyclotransferase